MADTGSGVGLIPEQAWENPDLPASPFGTATGVRVDRVRQRQGRRQRLAADLVGGAVRPARRGPSATGEITERPVDTVARYIDHTQGATTLTLTAPANGSLVTGTDHCQPARQRRTPTSTSTPSTSTSTVPRS